MKHLTNANQMLLTVLLMAIMASGLSISVYEFLTTATGYSTAGPILDYIYMSGWAFWQTTVILFILSVKPHLPKAFDNKIVLCYNILLMLTLTSDLKYLLQ